MESAVISSVVTGLVAILAGVVSASVGAHFTRKHSAAAFEATRKASEEQWLRTQEKDHLVWLRDQKQAAYMDFFKEAEVQLGQLSKWPSGDPESYAVDTHPLALDRARIKIVGDPGIRLMAREIESGLKEGKSARYLGMEYRQASPGETITDATKDRQMKAFSGYMAQLDELRDNLVNFVLAVRQDLGTATPHDEHLNEPRGGIIDIPVVPSAPDS